MASIRKNFIYNVLLNLSRVIFPLITAPYISRVLEPDGVGLFNFANTYAGYFALFAVLGIPTYGIREVAKLQADKNGLSRLTSELISISFFATILISVIYFLSLFLVDQLYENYMIFIVSGILLYFAPFRIDWFYSGLEQFGYITARTIIIRAISIICMFIFVHTKSDLIIYVMLHVAGTICGDIWNFIRLLKSGVRPKLVFSGLRKHMSPILILFTASIAISIYTVLDTLMLGFITNYQEVGFYNNAMHISRTLLAVVTSLSAVAIPRVSQYCKDRDYIKINDLANKSFSVVSFLAIPMALGVACIAPTFVPLFFGSEFMGSIIPLIILSFLIVAIGLNNLSGVQLLIGMGYDKLFLHSVLVGTITNFGMNLLLIPLIGAVGAAVASVLAEFLILGITVWFVYKKTPIRLHKNGSDLFKSLIGAVLFIPTILVLQRYAEGWTLVFLFVICGSLIYLLSQKWLRNKSIDLFLPMILKKLHIG